MSEQAVVGEGTEVNKGENARMASFVGALAIGTWTIKLPHWTCLVFQYFIPIFFERFDFPFFKYSLLSPLFTKVPFLLFDIHHLTLLFFSLSALFLFKQNSKRMHCFFVSSSRSCKNYSWS